MKTIIVLLVSIFFQINFVFSQEICNNSIDDDADGLIDLNDTVDCACNFSLIPNPSFEEYTNCPTNWAQSTGYIHAWSNGNNATPDYMNCGFYVCPSSGITPKTGTGMIGMVEGGTQAHIDINPAFAYFEYVASCLNAPLQKDSVYTLKYSLASTYVDGSTNSVCSGSNYGPLNFAIYGSPSCADIPYSGTNVPPSNWIKLGVASYTMTSSWTELTIIFTPSVDINSILIGPETPLPSGFPLGLSSCKPYFFLDDIKLTSTYSLTPKPITQIGNICLNNLVLEGSPLYNATYQWYKDGIAIVGQINLTLEVSNNGFGSGIYSLVSYVNGSCITSSINVESQVPIVNAGNDITICEGESISLSANGTGTFVWNTGANTANINVNPIVTTTYTLTASVNSYCTASDNVVVSVIQKPNINLGSDINVCPSVNTTIIAHGGNSYIWNNLNVNDTIIVSPSISATYTVTVSNGCTASEDIVVNVANALVTSISATPDSICEGSNAKLTASGGSFFNWNTGDNTSIINVSPISSNSYTVTVSDGNGCTATNSINIFVQQKPDYTITSDTICLGEMATIIAGGGTHYFWNNASQNPIINVSPAITTSYTVIINNDLCTDTLETFVLVNNLPIVLIDSSKIICSGDSITLTASGGANYLWSNLDTTSNILVYPSINTTYIVSVSDNNGCKNSKSVDVKVNPIPNADASSNKTICEGETAVLQATGGDEYFWNTLDSSSSITVLPLNSSTYFVTVSLNNCRNIDSVRIFVDSIPNLSLYPSNNINVCAGIDTVLSLSGAKTYLWSNNDTAMSIIIQPLFDSVYRVTASNGVCKVDTAFNVSVTEFPFVNLGQNIIICKGSDFVINAQSNVNQIVWSNDSIGMQIHVSDSGSYSIVASNMCGAAYDTIEVKNFPNSNLDLGRDTILCLNDYELKTNKSFIDYYWSTGEISSSILINIQGNYSVEVIDEFGCKLSDTITLINDCSIDNFLPNAFTPNNDGINDEFRMRASHIENFEMNIFNRWGQELYTSTEISKGWNGKYKEDDCSEGTYYYVISFQGIHMEKQTLTGSVTLTR